MASTNNNIVQVYDVEVDQNHDILNQGTIEIVKAYYDALDRANHHANHRALDRANHRALDRANHRALDRANHRHHDNEVQLVVPIKSEYYIAGISRIMQIICLVVGLIVVWDYVRINR